MIQLLIGLGAGAGATFAIFYSMNGGLPVNFLKTGPFLFSESADGQSMNLRSIDNTKSGMWSCEDGEYLGTENGSSTLKGVKMAISSENAGITIPLRMAAYTQWLKDLYDIHDIDELEEAVLAEAIKQDAWKHDIEIDAAENDAINLGVNDDWSELSKEDINFDKLDLTVDDVDPEMLKGFDMSVPIWGEEAPNPVVRFNDFHRFMKHNLNPSNIRADKNRIKARLKEELGGFSIDFETGMSIFMILIGIAAVTYFIM